MEPTTSKICSSRQDTNMVYVSSEFQDYDDEDPNLHFRKNRFDFWIQLKKARTEFLENHDVFDVYEFEKWLENNYGFKINVLNGNITDAYVIVDEKKYLVFLLKHS